MQRFTAARNADHGGRNLADRASAGLHAGTGRPARASSARQRHSRPQGRSRRPDHVSRARPARRVHAGRPAACAPFGVRDDGPAPRGGGDRMARDAAESRRTASHRRRVSMSRRRKAEAKIAALGLKVRNGCTYHGLAVNIAMDLAPFADIDPCGYPGPRRHAARRLRRRANRAAAGDELAPILASAPSILTMDLPQSPTTMRPASSTRATPRPRASRSRSSRPRR